MSLSVRAWGLGMFSGVGAWSFGSIEDWCLHFWDVQWGQCLEIFGMFSGVSPGALAVFRNDACKPFGNGFGNANAGFGDV